MYPSPVIEIRDLHKRHGDREVLRGINARVDKGETIAVVGPSGGGKSTLLRCLNYLEAFDAGTIKIAGFELTPGMHHGHRELLRRLRTAVGMVFQQFHLFPHLTALENVALGPVLVKSTPREAAAAQARELLGRVGLGDRGGAYPAQLSGGQQQRVAIARALAQKPQALLFDEPTSALDPEMRDDVLEVMKELSHGGMTMLVVTHEMQFAHDVAHRVWVMDGGTIVEDGPPSEVVDAPRSAVAKEFFRRVTLKKA
jgi:ABC-type polar amino acid transport system ATPase subunit